MSLGEISGLAQIMKVNFKGGLDEKNEAVLEGSIELAGKLRSFFGEKLSEMSESARILLVDIEFSKEQESDAAHSTPQDQYVGIVHFDKEVGKSGEVSVSAHARITLGLGIFPMLLAIKEDWIQIDIFAHWITEPTKHQNDDKILALVKRINFASAPIVRSPNKVDPEGSISSLLLKLTKRDWKGR